MLALKAEKISKQYRLGQVGTGTLTHDLNRFWHKVRGKENPYLKIGEANDRTSKGSSDYVWSLQDINFEIQQGDAVGIIGRNGAGKSTLLKILSKVTQPTTGKIRTNGRIASLLEVGTGFHPEMTGRENVFLNGAILGMTKKEITRKFDEIVDFSGVERYIDTPVKRYSSGMYVRLAFAVAAHLESEILIVDEVLAVGDADFQKKCLGKMGDVTKGEGRTILFVSHNMAAISALCNTGILLENGKMKDFGDINKVLDSYMNVEKNDETHVFFDENTKRVGNKNIVFESVEIFNSKEQHSNNFSIGDDIIVRIKINNKSGENKSELALQVKTVEDMPVFHIMARDSNFEVKHEAVGETYVIRMTDIRLFPGTYSITLTSASSTGHEVYDNIEDAISFNILDGGRYTHRALPRQAGLFFQNPEWTKII
ncbi:Teichoic acids export ATP-binding protein TagH [Chryseobacterium aquaeductus]|uniref:Teichoic acids export ATP-binding protein TagH n=1 Tax=Chryseobacterium aquaeductus TaxID=2675056 RepID=A0A9N8QRP0_9FLAO|nr:ABC transporter ATP-binding protein [Chryseobacterium aquaeductus]CAA7330477.1 Teichoic acids export ATP-binding protein TagH [Chryseobacterium potabilaquae]CAD7803909.1 Teichoic acids export ATP-binding protein TagH [Chryseobacterium aquaeductus]